MKFCTQCGTKVENDNQKFCANCGASLINNETNTAPSEIDSSDAYQNNNSYTNSSSYLNERPPYSNLLPMRWYKFLIYFGLFAGAVINFVNGIGYLTGEIYNMQTDGEVTSSFIYSYFKSLQVLDIIYGLILLALAAFGIFIRQQLAHYKKDAPRQLLIMYGIICGIQIVYVIVQMMILNNTAALPTMIGTVIGNVVGIALNYIYFKKRAHLFRN